MAIANPENYLTQASADARYQAVGSLGSSTPAQVDIGDTGTAGVSSSAARQDHEHPVAITSAQLVPAAWLAAWTSWTPTLTNLTQGNGTVTAAYVQMGKTVHFRFKFKLGSTSAVGTSPTFTLPVAPNAAYVSQEDNALGTVTILDSGSALFSGMLRYDGSSTVQVFSQLASGTTVSASQITSTSPMTWATGDTISISGAYEAA